MGTSIRRRHNFIDEYNRRYAARSPIRFNRCVRSIVRKGYDRRRINRRNAMDSSSVTRKPPFAVIHGVVSDDAGGLASGQMVGQLPPKIVGKDVGSWALTKFDSSRESIGTLARSGSAEHTDTVIPRSLRDAIFRTLRLD